MQRHIHASVRRELAGEGPPVGEVQAGDVQREFGVADVARGVRAPRNGERLGERRGEQGLLLARAGEVERADGRGLRGEVHGDLIGELQVQRRRGLPLLRDAEVVRGELAGGGDGLASLGQGDFAPQADAGAAEVHAELRADEVQHILVEARDVETQLALLLHRIERPAGRDGRELLLATRDLDRELLDVSHREVEVERRGEAAGVREAAARLREIETEIALEALRQKIGLEREVEARSELRRERVHGVRAAGGLLELHVGADGELAGLTVLDVRHGHAHAGQLGEQLRAGLLGLGEADGGVLHADGLDVEPRRRRRLGGLGGFGFLGLRCLDDGREVERAIGMLHDVDGRSADGGLLDGDGAANDVHQAVARADFLRGEDRLAAGHLELHTAQHDAGERADRRVLDGKLRTNGLRDARQHDALAEHRARHDEVGDDQQHEQRGGGEAKLLQPAGFLRHDSSGRRSGIVFSHKVECGGICRAGSIRRDRAGESSNPRARSRSGASNLSRDTRVGVRSRVRRPCDRVNLPRPRASRSFIRASRP